MPDIYPEKPVIKEKESKDNYKNTLLSMVLFVITFYIFFSDEILFISFLLFVLFIHELGHFSFMKKFKYKHVKMLFVPLMGAFVQGKKKIYSQKESLLVVGAGPFPGIILGVVFFFLFSAFKVDWLLFLAIMFFLLNIINLLPIDPLDGGQLLKLLLKKSSDLFLLSFSFISSLSLIAIGFFIDSWLMILFGFLMGFRVRKLQQSYYIRKELKTLHLNYVIDYDDLSNKDYAALKSIVLDHNPTIKKYIEMSDEDIDDIIANQVSNILISPMNMDASKWFRLFIILFWIFSFTVPFILFFNYDMIDFIYGLYGR